MPQTIIAATGNVVNAVNVVNVVKQHTLTISASRGKKSNQI